ncbi:MAG: tryptophan--tRNA ligase, partial [Alphaproteobacteria bacterium]|nr:tryptophan--tRNA ligase [Alphaproteobacteria bacterium]
NRDTTRSGLFMYPVLMAADIVLYDATHVPVGEDQKQHVEFARDIVQVFNNLGENPVLRIPEPVIQQSGARIKSLRDGLKKMSKSDPSDYSRIHLNDSNDDIAQKIKKAKTDSGIIQNCADDLAKRPELENLITLYALLSKKPLAESLIEFDGKSFSDLKGVLTDLLITEIEPIRCKVDQLMNDQTHLRACLARGGEKALSVATDTMQRVRTTLNLLQAGI